MKKYIVLLGLIAFGSVLIIFNNVATKGTLLSLRQSGSGLIPKIFPFTVLGFLFVKFGGVNVFEKIFGKFFTKIFGLSGRCTLPFVVSLISGYPTSAIVLGEAVKREEISREEAENIIGWCSNPSLAFVLANTGNFETGIILWLSVVISGIIIGIICGRKTPTVICGRAYEKETESIAGGFCDSVKEAAETMVKICGFVVFFGSFLFLADVLGILEIVAVKIGVCSKIFEGTVLGFIEVVYGLNKLADIPLDSAIKIPLFSMMLAWSGVCMHMQVASALTKHKISLKKYIKTKSLQMILAPCCGIALMKIIPLSQTVAYITPTHISFKFFSWVFMCAWVLSIIILYIFSVFSRNILSTKK